MNRLVLPFLAVALLLITQPNAHAQNNWTQRSLATSPTARSGAGLVRDANDGLIYLFGGDDGGTPLNDTWSYNGTTWTQLSPGASPSIRRNFGMVYDSTDQQVLLFGGAGTVAVNSQTWKFNGTTWTQQSPATSPSARQGMGMAYDSVSNETIMFGGSDAAGTRNNETWRWNGSNWSQLSPMHSPPARTFTNMVYDPDNDVIVLFGGSDGAALSDTWIWNGSDWTEVSPSTVPAARAFHGMGYDTAQNKVLLFGGVSGSTYYQQTWSWNGTNWTQESPADSPLGLSDPAVTFDDSRNQLVLFGGTNATSPFVYGQTWEYGLPLPTPTATATPTVTMTSTPTATQTSTPTATPTSVATSTETPTPSPTPTPTATQTEVPVVTATATPTITPTPSDSDSDGVRDDVDCAPLDRTKSRNKAFQDLDLDGYISPLEEVTTTECFGTLPPRGYRLTSTSLDNCPTVFNSDQLDRDSNAIGNACDQSSSDVVNSGGTRRGVTVSSDVRRAKKLNAPIKKSWKVTTAKGELAAGQLESLQSNGVANSSVVLYLGEGVFQFSPQAALTKSNTLRERSSIVLRDADLSLKNGDFKFTGRGQDTSRLSFPFGAQALVLSINGISSRISLPTSKLASYTEKHRVDLFDIGRGTGINGLKVTANMAVSPERGRATFRISPAISGSMKVSSPSFTQLDLSLLTNLIVRFQNVEFMVPKSVIIDKGDSLKFKKKGLVAPSFNYDGGINTRTGNLSLSFGCSLKNSSVTTFSPVDPRECPVFDPFSSANLSILVERTDGTISEIFNQVVINPESFDMEARLYGSIRSSFAFVVK